ncbi:protein-export chaperone SecB [Thermosediminibacter litoriperuensis]|uniref:Preprotein translocase subunit SecB n=1 Tax=Thermosediminibacter litoriperuensis TaxID=291989 RepID=A0A5S5B042_9FIRM|nr:protein-export chaperone SecB [Thermosediminibacter litoriperuensis]TYP58586.1 preprotein translocase subunit SecB [Thermosediminibacter litoriperuensis]
MIDSNKVVASFQMIASRVVKFELETKEISNSKEKVNIKNDFDYEVIKIEEHDEAYYGVVQFKSNFIAKIGKSILFKISIVYEGKFLGNKNSLKQEDFKKMLELNGVVALSQFTRSYVLSATALAGINPPVRMPMINIHKLRKLKEEMKQSKEV